LRHRPESGFSTPSFPLDWRPRYGPNPIYARTINTDLLHSFAEGSSYSKFYPPMRAATMIKNKTYFPKSGAEKD